MKISIVIPCYNEKNTIEKIVAAVCTAPIENKEIIVVDDCSQDGTQAVLKERLQTRNVELCSCADRRGDYCYTKHLGTDSKVTLRCNESVVAASRKCL